MITHPENRPDAEINDKVLTEIDAAMQRVRLARSELIKRRGRKYTNEQPQRNWRSPVKDE